MNATKAHDRATGPARPQGAAPAAPASRGTALKAGLAGKSFAQQAAMLAPGDDEYSDPSAPDANAVGVPGLGQIVGMANAKEKPVTDWLSAHRREVDGQPKNAIVERVVRECPGAQALRTPEIESAVTTWAGAHGVRVAAPTAAPAAGTSVTARATEADIEAAFSGAAPPGAVPSMRLDCGRVHLSLSGLTVDLLTEGPLKAEVSGLPSGAVGFKASHGPVNLNVELSHSSWLISLSFPGDTHLPMLPLVSDVVTRGVAGLTQIAVSAHNAKDKTDVDTTPIKAVTPAIQALGAMFEHRTQGGDVQAGVTAQGGMNGRGASVMGTVTVTL